jgi:hypothetical protein
VGNQAAGIRSIWLPEIVFDPASALRFFALETRLPRDVATPNYNEVHHLLTFTTDLSAVSRHAPRDVDNSIVSQPPSYAPHIQ